MYWNSASRLPRVSLILKISIFATGCAGIVAEFVLSTLATYLTGNAIFQWTIIMSLMLFSMGVGSRFSKFFRKHLLDAFIIIEFILSILCSISAAAAYGLAAYTTSINLVIYGLAVIIGGFIGLEIPLVTRLNQDYEELRTNIANVMEKDYYGALLGGLFFAFFALPRLGLTYTPIILGAINFLVASLFLFFFYDLIHYRKTMIILFSLCSIGLSLLGLFAKPIIQYGEQKQYADKIIYAEQTPYQKIVITRFKSNYWLYINGQQQFSTVDEERYHEPLIHPALTAAADKRHILILGGGDGLALREIWKYKEVESVTMVDLDPAMTRLAVTDPVLTGINRNSMKDPRLKLVHTDAGKYLKETNDFFNIVIADLPDPDTADLMHLYSTGFYQMIHRHLLPGGILVTQATSPYFSKKAFWCIIKTIQASGFSVLPYHNQVPTMGEWGWVLAVKKEEMDADTLKKKIMSLHFGDIQTRFINHDAVISMVHFGKGMIDPEKMKHIEINTQAKPVLHRYYREGAWAVY